MSKMLLSNKMNNKSKRFMFFNSKGISLVEVLVAAALVALMVTSVLAVVAQNVVASKNIDMIYVSTNLAKKRMDSLKLLNFMDLTTMAPESDVAIDDEGEPNGSGSYVRTTEITADYDGNPYLMKVKVSVDRIVMGELSGRPAVIETLFADIE